MRHRTVPLDRGLQVHGGIGFPHVHLPNSPRFDLLHAHRVVRKIQHQKLVALARHRVRFTAHNHHLPVVVPVRPGVESADRNGVDLPIFAVVVHVGIGRAVRVGNVELQDLLGAGREQVQVPPVVDGPASPSATCPWRSPGRCDLCRWGFLGLLKRQASGSRRRIQKATWTRHRTGRASRCAP